jgi:hypothetical protein
MITAGETLDKIEATASKINDSSHILNYNSTKRKFEVAATGRLTVIK